MNKDKNPVKQSFDISKIINLVPGTLVYRGVKSEPFSIELYRYNSDNYTIKNFSKFQELKNYLASETDIENPITWINITGINQVEEIEKVGNFFGIIELILEQILSISKHSMCKYTNDYIFNDVQMIYLEDNKINNENISIYKNAEYIITFQERKGDVFDPIRERISHDLGTIRDSDLGYTYFSVLDALIDNYLNVMEMLKLEVVSMEEKVTNLDVLEVTSIHQVRKHFMLIKFSANPIEKLVQQLLSNQNILGINNNVYIESLSDHIKEVQNELLLQKEIVDGLFQNYMLNNSNDMNNIMTTLTIFSAIFIPLSFLAGVFGMNFENMPGLANMNGFYYFIVGCVLTIISMITFFKVKKWY
jgi:magnesium transporter